jgi:hypothetical protein
VVTEHVKLAERLLQKGNYYEPAGKIPWIDLLHTSH